MKRNSDTDKTDNKWLSWR